MGGGKFKHRLHSKGALKVQKGMSSSSNPTRNRHRAAALAMRNASVGGAANLAVEDRPENDCDDLLDALPMENMAIGSSKSMISDGGLSKITDITSCTNPAFDSVNRVWKSGSSIQTEVVSVLGAIAEFIKERGGKESDVEYFAALITALEGSVRGNAKRTAAIAYLLHLIVRKVPKAVLQAQFSSTVQTLYTKLLENIDSTEGSALKNLISVLGIVLRAQPSVVWASVNTRNILVSVSALASHERPWVRTMARRAIRAVLTDPVTATDNELHPASGAVGQFILQHIENFLSTKGDNTNVVRNLCLLEGIMHKMPANLFKKLAEAMLKCFALSDPMVKCSALQCLHRALQRHPSDSALPTETNVLLLNALRQLSTSATDITVTAYWIQALTEAHVCLTVKDAKKSVQMAHQSIPMMVKLFESGSEQLAQVAYQMLSRLIENTIKDDADSGKLILSLLDASITVKTASVWKFILRTEMKLYDVCGDSLEGEELTKALRTLAQLRDSDQCFCRPELDFTIGAAVRHVGVAPVLAAIPLDVNPDAAILSTEFKTSWLVPILRVNIHNAPLAIFTKHFLPIAMKIYRRLKTLEPQTQRVYTTFQFQMWELLPSFLESPTDLETSFSEIAMILGVALSERKDLRMTVLTSLRRALKFCLQPDAPAERVEVLSKYAKNYMPILFNMYTSSTADGEYDDKGVRLSVLETIRLYVEVAPIDLLNTFVDKAIQTSKGSEASSQKQARVLDILCALTRSVLRDSLSKILDCIQPWFNSTDVNGLQKKAYRILEEILQRRSSAEVETLLVDYADYVENTLVRPLDSVPFPARAAYCSCLHMSVEKCETFKELSRFLDKTLDNVILMLDKENNTHTRQNSSKCLQFICIKLGELSEDESISSLSLVLHHIFDMTTLKAGAETLPLNVSRSALVSLNIIAQKQIKTLNATLISRIVSHACNFMGDGRAPVRILAIRLVRVLVQKMQEYMLHQFRELILTSVFEGQLTSDLTVKVRKANRLLLEVLVEKFGVNVLEKYTSKPDWVKQMKNIEKCRRRKERKAAGEAMDDGEGDDGASVISSSHVSARTAGADTILELLEDSDNEDNDSDGDELMMKKSVVANSVWLKNEGDDADVPIDLLDSSRMIDKITTTNPAVLERRRQKALERKSKNEDGFKFTKDGRLVILEDDNDKTPLGKTRKRTNDISYLEEGVTEGKRQKADSDLESLEGDDYDDDDDMDDRKTRVTKVSKAGTAVSYGGKGIYRDTTGRSQVGTSKSRPKGEPQKKKPAGAKGVQPYAYVPLRNKNAGQDVRKVLKANRKSGKGGKKVVF